MGSIGNEIPSGVILMWSGTIANIPAGWFLCDGNNGTPNLTDRFVIHADADSGGTNNPGDTGGASTVTLTGAQSGVKAHNHPQDADTMIERAGALKDGNSFTTIGGTTQNNTAEDASSSHSNRDKYHALAFIMKS